MRLEQLHYLSYLAKSGSMTAVAEHFFLSRQAVSSSIRQLEEELGYPILKRSNSELSFTKAGEEVLAFADQLLAQEQNLVSRLKEISAEEEAEGQQWRIYSVSAIANDAIPKIVHTLMRQDGRYVINFNMTDVDTLLEKLKTEKCDIGLITVNPNELERRMQFLGTEYFQYELLGEDSFIFCVNKKYYKDTSTVIQLAEVEQYTKGVYSAVLDKKHLENEQVISADLSLLSYSNDADFHRNMLQYENYGVLMPSLVFKKFFDQRKYTMLTIDVVPTKLYHVAIYPKKENEKIRAFIRDLKKYIRE